MKRTNNKDETRWVLYNSTVFFCRKCKKFTKNLKFWRKKSKYFLGRLQHLRPKRATRDEQTAAGHRFLMPDANDNEHESNAILPIITSIYQQLPQNFSFTNVLPITQSLGIPRATVYRYLTILIQHKKISRIKYNTYEKN